ncbi:MAG: hypothetical protein IT373_07595 [Polyangiaceae bacterium]|nr:hypothetical protein [Polyangiaceae bacterium]
MGPGRAEPGLSLALGLEAGLGARLGDPLFVAKTGVGLLLGARFEVLAVPEVAIGIAYEHRDLGSETTGMLASGTADIDHSAHVLSAVVRAYPARIPEVGGFLELGLGAAWQRVDARGVTWAPGMPGGGRSFVCKGGDTAGFALRAALGADVALGAGVRWLSAAGLDVARLGDDVLDSCAPGAGTTTGFALRTGFAYLFDVSGG